MPGVPLNITIPEVGVTSWPTWAQNVQDAFETIVADLEPAITTAEINENADHDFNGYAIDDVRTISFRAGNTTDIPTPGIGFDDGEFVVRDESGNAIQFTANGAINVTGFGGIAGDYVSAGAAVDYTDASTLYEFFDGTGAYADIRADDVLISNGANEVTITYGGSTDYTLTLPSAVPAAVALVTMSTAGALSTSGTIATGFTVSNANITLSGTSEIKHPDIVESYPAAFTNYHNTTVGTVTTRTDGGLSVASAAWTAYFRIPPARTGDRFKSVTFRISKGGAGGADTTTLSLYKVPSTGTLPAAFASQTNTTLGATSVTVTSSSTLAAGEYIVAGISFSATGTNVVYSQQPTWDRP